MADRLVLRIARGLPGSGKTTLAEAWVAQDPQRRARVNRDDLRRMLYAGRFIAPDSGGGPGTAWQVVAVRDAAIGALLRAGVSVMCDDTNLPDDVVADLHTLAGRHGAAADVVDLRGVTLETCLARVAARAAAGGRLVPADVIRTMWAQLVVGRGPYAPR